MDTCALDGATNVLLDALSQVHGGISWATDVVQIYQAIQDAYKLLSRPGGALPRPVQELALQLKQLEKYMTIDLERHIAWSNGRGPYYLDRLQGHLGTALDILKDPNALKNDSPNSQRELNHLAAELQATFFEYGFCLNIEAIFDAEEAKQRLDTLSRKLSELEKRATSDDPSTAFADLHLIIANQNGIQQAMTERNIAKVQGKIDDINRRIVALENNITGTNIRSDSKVFLEYLAAQHLLRKPFVSTIFQSDPAETINGHMIHPATRGWLLDRFSRWLLSTGKRVFFISSKEGTGKTALASAVCKLFNHDVIASHYFDSSCRNPLTNRVIGLIQSVASDMCNTLPEYVNFLDDEFGEKDLRTVLSDSWQQVYQVLLKSPLQAIYGVGRNASAQTRRKLIVIDGLDECTRNEWADLKDFLKSFAADISSSFCFLLTVRTEAFSSTVPYNNEDFDGLQLEDRAWVNRHIKDIEIYLSSSVGAILSGEDERGTPSHAKADEMTLQKTIDELLKSSSGRFDYALELMEAFAREMGSTGQFLSSLKKAATPVRQAYGSQFEENMADFSSPYRSYRDKEGRSVGVRVMRQSHYLMDKSRAALIRGRHKAS